MGEGERRKRIGMARAARRGDRWKARMGEMIVKVARMQRHFTSDDVMSMAHAVGIKKPEGVDGRAFGPVMAAAARDGICTKAKRPPMPSVRPTLHASPLQVWKSNIFGKRWVA